MLDPHSFVLGKDGSAKLACNHAILIPDIAGLRTEPVIEVVTDGNVGGGTDLGVVVGGSGRADCRGARKSGCASESRDEHLRCGSAVESEDTSGQEQNLSEQIPNLPRNEAIWSSEAGTAGPHPQAVR